MRKILVIINKKAGTDREKSIQGVIEKHLPKDRFSVEITYLQYLGHGADLARDAVKANVDTVVAVGGDGSINEIAQGLVGSNTALAIIPLGSGNGLARALKIPLNTAAAFQIIVDNKRQRMDVGYANEHLFLSNAGVGFDAVIADKFQHSKKRGLINYARLVISSFKNYVADQYNITSDKQQSKREAFLLTVANGNQFGYEFKLAPDASVFDGKLDVCVVPPINFWGLLPLSIHSLRGTINKSKYMQHFTGEQIHVKGQQLNCLQVDGDAAVLSTPGEVAFKIVPAAIDVIIP
ncbi:diacylglycerol/lipid kinase family protein [Chitinophaga skermanii]|uniref:diacylglycerol/lipid kinase family protein n=1 Tax=Chitinophaga skermanii TaxID=331697 RepID=UPI001314BAA5|nr:diacylglycerol kinase family protein [Chitinophaga skermanii]